MDRLQALRDTANLPRAMVPHSSTHPNSTSVSTVSSGMERRPNDLGTTVSGGMEQRLNDSETTISGGMEQRLNDSGLDLRMDDSLTDIQWLHRMDAGQLLTLFPFFTFTSELFSSLSDT